MATVTFAKDQQLEIDQQKYIVVDRLFTGDIQLYNQKLNEYRIEKENHLVQLLLEGILKIIGLPKGRGIYENTDWNQLDPTLRTEAERRETYVKHYLAMASKIKRSKALRKKVIGIVASQLCDYNPPSEISLYRWTRFYETTENERSLVPLTEQRGAQGSNLDPKVRNIIEQAIDEIYMTRERNSGDDVLARVKYLLGIENAKPDQKEFLPDPDRSTIYRFIEKRNKYDVALVRYGKNYANRYFAAYKQGARPKKALERVEVDSTKIDVIIIDEKTKQIIGRAWLTVAVDCYSRQILGFFISFEPPSFLTIAECLKHAIAPKGYVKTKFPNIKNAWEVFGIPRIIVCDNGREYHCGSFIDACKLIGVNIIYNPPKTPWWKAHVERFIGTAATRVFHRIPGTTFSSIIDKDDYKSEDYAIMTLEKLEEILHVWIVDIYQMEWHRGAKACPRDKWREGIVDNPPRVPEKMADLLPMMGAVDYRVIQRKGIELDGLIYESQELRDLSHHYSRGEKAKIKFRPADLSSIWVWSKVVEDWLLVPAIDQEYTLGLTSWLHQLNKKVAHEKYGEVNGENLILAKNYLWELLTKGSKTDDKGTKNKKKGTKAARAERQGLKNTNPDIDPKPVIGVEIVKESMPVQVDGEWAVRKTAVGKERTLGKRHEKTYKESK